MQETELSLFPKVLKTCVALEAAQSNIPQNRKKILRELSEYISEKQALYEVAQIVVVCTHNSRRSHMAQLWLAVAADFYGLSNIETFSGGTEATALNPRVIPALVEVGFHVEKGASAQNPIYRISWSHGTNPYEAFSKKYDKEPNPDQDFAAVMVCSEADEACPFVEGCDFRLALPFDDPKEYDDTIVEAEKYLERMLDIGREMIYVMSRVKKAQGN